MTTGRIVRSTDFERVLRMPPRARSPHFALHHVGGGPSRFVRKQAMAVGAHTAPVPGPTELSTGPVVNSPEPVDDFQDASVGAPRSIADASMPAACRWLGTVVPKRHARRSVTRSLLKRQMHAAFERETRLPAGLWVVRLRTGFDRKQFPSAASDALRRIVRDELDAMLAGLMRRLEPAERGA